MYASQVSQPSCSWGTWQGVCLPWLGHSCSTLDPLILRPSQERHPLLSCVLHRTFSPTEKYLRSISLHRISRSIPFLWTVWTASASDTWFSWTSDSCSRLSHISTTTFIICPVSNCPPSQTLEVFSDLVCNFVLHFKFHILPQNRPPFCQFTWGSETIMRWLLNKKGGLHSLIGEGGNCKYDMEGKHDTLCCTFQIGEA